MAISYVGGVTGSGTNTAFDVSLNGTLTGGSNSSPSTGDIVIVSTGFASQSNLDPGVNTAGYTEIVDIWSDDSIDSNLSVNWKIMGASVDTAVNIKPSAESANSTTAVVSVWRGVDSSTPIDVATTTATGINGNPINSPTITPSTSGAVVLSTGHASSGVNVVAWTKPTGYSNDRSISANNTRGSNSVIASKAWTSGAEDPGAWTADQTNAQWAWCAATVVLRPAASGPANLKSYNTNLKANIKSINTNLIANVKSLDTNV